MRRLVFVALALFLVVAPTARAEPRTERFAEVVQQILAQPYQPAYVPEGNDSAFTDEPVANTFPSQDYTSGSRPGNPDAPNWPSAFSEVLIRSSDGAPLPGRVALHPGEHPGVVVVHGFNSNAKHSIIRWAAMLYARGYNVAAIDQRDFPPGYRAGYGYPDWLQTFGWKETDDVLAAGRFLKQLPGVTSVGVMGFSLGGQNVVLALARDGRGGADRVFAAGLNFSGPADQNAQIYSTAEPPGCFTPFCTYPVTGALMTLVVPPFTYSDPCLYLGDAGRYYGTTPYDILANESAFRAQIDARAPLLNVYAADDPLVHAFHARMMAGYDASALQATLLLEHGLHAYFNDRWWQQKLALLYFKALLPGAANDAAIGTEPTVNQTPGGAPAGEQLVDLGAPTRADADALLAPYICDTSQPSPGSGSGG
jgi:predicted alpha/beta-fold hydrolase